MSSIRQQQDISDRLNILSAYHDGEWHGMLSIAQTKLDKLVTTLFKEELASETRKVDDLREEILYEKPQSTSYKSLRCMSDDNETVEARNKTVLSKLRPLALEAIRKVLEFNPTKMSVQQKTAVPVVEQPLKEVVLNPVDKLSFMPLDKEDLPGDILLSDSITEKTGENIVENLKDEFTVVLPGDVLFKYQLQVKEEGDVKDTDQSQIYIEEVNEISHPVISPLKVDTTEINVSGNSNEKTGKAAAYKYKKSFDYFQLDQNESEDHYSSVTSIVSESSGVYSADPEDKSYSKLHVKSDTSGLCNIVTQEKTLVEDLNRGSLGIVPEDLIAKESVFSGEIEPKQESKSPYSSPTVNRREFVENWAASIHDNVQAEETQKSNTSNDMKSAESSPQFGGKFNVSNENIEVNLEETITKENVGKKSNNNRLLDSTNQLEDGEFSCWIDNINADKTEESFIHHNVDDELVPNVNIIVVGDHNIEVSEEDVQNDKCLASFSDWDCVNQDEIYRLRATPAEEIPAELIDAPISPNLFNLFESSSDGILSDASDETLTVKNVSSKASALENLALESLKLGIYPLDSTKSNDGFATGYPANQTSLETEESVVKRNDDATLLQTGEAILKCQNQDMSINIETLVPYMAEDYLVCDVFDQQERISKTEHLPLDNDDNVSCLENVVSDEQQVLKRDFVVEKSVDDTVTGEIRPNMMKTESGIEELKLYSKEINDDNEPYIHNEVYDEHIKTLFAESSIVPNKDIVEMHRIDVSDDSFVVQNVVLPSLELNVYPLVPFNSYTEDLQDCTRKQITEEDLVESVSDKYENSYLFSKLDDITSTPEVEHTYSEVEETSNDKQDVCMITDLHDHNREKLVDINRTDNFVFDQQNNFEATTNESVNSGKNATDSNVKHNTAGELSINDIVDITDNRVYQEMAKFEHKPLNDEHVIGGTIGEHENDGIIDEHENDGIIGEHESISVHGEIIPSVDAVETHINEISIYGECVPSVDAVETHIDDISVHRDIIPSVDTVETHIDDISIHGEIIPSVDTVETHIDDISVHRDIIPSVDAIEAEIKELDNWIGDDYQDNYICNKPATEDIQSTSVHSAMDHSKELTSVEVVHNLVLPKMELSIYPVVPIESEDSQSFKGKEIVEEDLLEFILFDSGILFSKLNEIDKYQIENNTNMTDSEVEEVLNSDKRILVGHMHEDMHERFLDEEMESWLNMTKEGKYVFMDDKESKKEDYVTCVNVDSIEQNNVDTVQLMPHGIYGINLNESQCENETLDMLSEPDAPSRIKRDKVLDTVPTPLSYVDECTISFESLEASHDFSGSERPSLFLELTAAEEICAKDIVFEKTAEQLYASLITDEAVLKQESNICLIETDDSSSINLSAFNNTSPNYITGLPRSSTPLVVNQLQDFQDSKTFFNCPNEKGQHLESLKDNIARPSTEIESVIINPDSSTSYSDYVLVQPTVESHDMQTLMPVNPNRLSDTEEIYLSPLHGKNKKNDVSASSSAGGSYQREIDVGMDSFIDKIQNCMSSMMEITSMVNHEQKAFQEEEEKLSEKLVSTSIEKN